LGQADAACGVSPPVLSLGDIAERRVIFEVCNPEGHPVRLDEVAWDHVLDQHVEMSEYLVETMAALPFGLRITANPIRRRAGNATSVAAVR
jgi:hypothetical protein